jgi:hypothetical protein
MIKIELYDESLQKISQLINELGKEYIKSERVF